MEIIGMTIEHYDEVYSLWESSEGVGLSSADSKEAVESYLKRNPSMSFIFVENNVIRGAILCGHDGRRGYIHHLAVHKDCRKRGVAKKLVKRVLSSLNDLGIKKCHLFVFKNNPAVSFWKNIGWEYREDIAVMSNGVQ